MIYGTIKILKILLVVYCFNKNTEDFWILIDFTFSQSPLVKSILYLATSKLKGIKRQWLLQKYPKRWFWLINYTFFQSAFLGMLMRMQMHIEMQAETPRIPPSAVNRRALTASSLGSTVPLTFDIKTTAAAAAEAACAGRETPLTCDPSTPIPNTVANPPPLSFPISISTFCVHIRDALIWS